MRINLIRTIPAVWLIITVWIAGLATPAYAAKQCNPAEFATVMDDTGERLNTLAAKNSKQIETKTAQLKAKQPGGNTARKDVPLSKAGQLKLIEYNTQFDVLMNRMDRLGDLTRGGSSGCQRLKDLETTSSTLLKVQQQRFALIDRELSAQLKPARLPAKKPASIPLKKKKSLPPAAAPKWTTTTKIEQALPQSAAPTIAAPKAPNVNLPPVLSVPLPVEETFSVAEIKAAGRGFFGTISTSLANGINYTFQKVGRPTGYILGREGGGAFLAGLRYGKGRLIMKRYGSQKVYWRGPSLGYDAGAEGSRTMFLIYNLRNPKQLYRRFSGADGAAYLVGGVGITFLTNGKIVMAPIRSGIGLRLGASVGYLKFSDKPGWNPF